MIKAKAIILPLSHHLGAPQMVQPLLYLLTDKASMSLYELLDVRVNRNLDKPVKLYELLEARLKERESTDKLWRVLEARLKEIDRG
jgi:hypothetical protein